MNNRPSESVIKQSIKRVIEFKWVSIFDIIINVCVEVSADDADDIMHNVVYMLCCNMASEGYLQSSCDGRGNYYFKRNR